MLSGPAGGIWRPKRLFTKPMSICFGVQGASEMILGAKNVFSGCLTPVPLDRNIKKNHIEKINNLKTKTQTKKNVQSSLPIIYIGSSR